MIPFALGNVLTHAGLNPLCLCCCPEEEEVRGGGTPGAETRRRRRSPNPLVQASFGNADRALERTPGEFDQDRLQGALSGEGLLQSDGVTGLPARPSDDARDAPSGRATVTPLESASPANDEVLFDLLALLAIEEADEEEGRRVVIRLEGLSR